MKHRTPRRLVGVIAVLFGAVILVGAGVVVLGKALVDQAILKQEPQYTAQEYGSRGAQQLASGDLAAAEASLEAAYQQQNDGTYRSDLAVVKYRLKKYEEAIALYRAQVTAGSDVTFALNGIGNTYRDWFKQDGVEGYRDEALAAYQAAIGADPKSVAPYSNQAQFLEELGRTQEALAVVDAGVAATADPILTQLRERLTAEQ